MDTALDTPGADRLNLRNGERRLDDLIPNPDNYNQHEPERIAEMVAKIQAVGFTNPVLVDEDTGILVAGHRRRLALFWLREHHYPEPPGIGPGWMVPTREGHWTDIQRYQVLVGDNEDPAKVKFDAEKLAEVLSLIDNTAGTLDGTGYGKKDLEKLLSEIVPGDEDEDAEESPLEEEEQAPMEVPEQYVVVVECANESQQLELLDRLTEEGWKCRALLS